MSSGNTDRQIQFMCDLGSTILCCTPSYAAYLAESIHEDVYKRQEIDHKDLPASNLTFLIDTSGSMLSYDKLPLLQQAFSLLVENLTEKDTVSIVTYAGSSAVLLDSAQGNEKERILSAINHLEDVYKRQFPGN